MARMFLFFHKSFRTQKQKRQVDHRVNKIGVAHTCKERITAEDIEECSRQHGAVNGSDVLTTLHYYAIGDPLTLIAAFIPEEHMLRFYEILLILRLYLAGVAFSCYCFYRGKRDNCAVLAGTFLYVFCGYALFSRTGKPGKKPRTMP